MSRTKTVCVMGIALTVVCSIATGGCGNQTAEEGGGASTQGKPAPPMTREQRQQQIQNSNLPPEAKAQMEAQLRATEMRAQSAAAASAKGQK